MEQTTPVKLSAFELGLIEAWRKADPHDTITIRKMKGQLEGEITVTHKWVVARAEEA